ncbi:MAG: TcpQ domain-containing protein [Gammaproteobacteria bacterium]|nr:TcpQ domain-containing protein [Gammaproteobacteria bacterium]
MSATRGGNAARCAAMVGALMVGTHLGGCRIAWPGLGGVAPEKAAAPAPEPVVATVRVVRERRALPEALESREVAFATRSPMRVERIAGQLADLLELSVVVEDRPARDGENVTLADSQLLTVASSGSVREVLNDVAAAAGYEWEYDDRALAPRIVLYRYRDAAWRAGHASADEREGRLWRMDPARHATVREVLEEWGRTAGWTVVWEVEDLDYAVSAAATFHGTFEEAVDALLRDTRGYRVLVPTAWRANRYLTVHAGG